MVKSIISIMVCASTLSAQWSAPVRYSGNPIGLANGSVSWATNQFNDPVVIIPCLFDGTKGCFYVGGCGTGASCTGPQTIGKGTFPLSGLPTTFTMTWDTNPIISDVNRRLDSIINPTGTTLYMYSTNTSGSNQSIDEFTSTDGGATWPSTPSNSNILTPTGQGCTDGTDVSQFAALKLGTNSYIAWYSYRISGNLLGGLRTASSTDGITWTKNGCTNVLTTAQAQYSQGYVEQHQAYIIGSSVAILYESWSGPNFGRCTGTNCGCVGGNWTNNVAWVPLSTPTANLQNSNFNPLLSASGTTAAFDQYYVATPAWFLYGGQNYLLFQGNGTSGCYLAGPWSLGVATMSGTLMSFINQIAGPTGQLP